MLIPFTAFVSLPTMLPKEYVKAKAVEKAIFQVQCLCILYASASQQSYYCMAEIGRYSSTPPYKGKGQFWSNT